MQYVYSAYMIINIKKRNWYITQNLINASNYYNIKKMRTCHIFSNDLIASRKRKGISDE